jgi:hypothetical protein
VPVPLSDTCVLGNLFRSLLTRIHAREYPSLCCASATCFLQTYHFFSRQPACSCIHGSFAGGGALHRILIILGVAILGKCELIGAPVVLDPAAVPEAARALSGAPASKQEFQNQSLQQFPGNFPSTPTSAIFCCLFHASACGCVLWPDLLHNEP